MKNLFSRFGVAGTELTHNSFSTARSRLTILYTFVFGTLILIVSGILFYYFAADIHEDMRSIYSDESVQTRIINQHKTPLRNLTLIIDGILICFTAGVSYYLTGITLRPIQENYEAQKRFIANASHEMRTPIAILKADLEIYLSDKNLPSGMLPIFRGYLEEIDQMNYIVENLMTLFRFESHQVTLKLEKISLKELVIKSTNKMRSYAKTHGIILKLTADKNVFISGDAFFMQQAFRNILKNAIEYSNKNGVVEVLLTKKDNVVKIQVTDQGIGIAKENLCRISHRFYRTDQSKSKRSEGMGLGLSIVQYIIEIHRGSFQISSQPHQGTKVTISFPQLTS